ncbi:N-ethylammeline chlorohydrolase [Azoarcus olearius]|uniref:TRZ/ATZ family hydrolase n=1 Tax=Azoarcus sp. (strain BH72) TaxID=418699 RepID=UPI000806379F|nr:TRZ/ATZ family hydrolase [Azoarcus olearius]ANQ85777.1 N-ethylammeline chlorohydrolase [Azoarcus olearius]
MSNTVDLLIFARWIIPIEPAATVLENHALAVRDGRIIALLPSTEARAQYTATREFLLDHHVLLPGLVNAHTHAAMNLMRGIADDLPLMRWLQEAIWPVEGQHVSAEFVRDGTLLAIAEMLRGGITTFNDMYFHPEAAAEAADMLGMRALLGLVVIDAPTPYASDADDYLAKGLAVRDRWRSHPRIGFALAPHAPYTVSDRSFERIASFAGELDLPVHIHLHESADEIRGSLAEHQLRPISRLAHLGLLGENLLGIHAVHLDDSDIDLLARHRCAIAHCPTSNMKLASGIAPIARAASAGITVALGTDGAASNNRLDILQEMRHAALLAKVSTGDASALPAHQVLRMATLDGACALGLDERIGSLEVGKQADLCAIDLSSIATQPCFDPASHVVYAAGREHVSHVWIDGETRVDQGIALLQISDRELLRLAALWQTKLVN